MAKIAHIDLGENPLLLAPMEDVSDPPFRHLCKKNGADMLYTEFISSDGLIRDADKSLKKLDIFEDERPVGIQIFGGEIEAMTRSAEIVEAAKPELLDINYGCPIKNVVCKNAGSGVLRDIDKMVKLTEAIVKSTKLPVTVKTRIGWDANSVKIVEVAERLQDVGIHAISIHCRTKHQMYTGKADWTWIAKVKENPRLRIPVFGNGDVMNGEDAKTMLEQYGADGVMIGRAVECAGIHDILSKCIGTNNPQNVIHATVDALKRLRAPASRDVRYHLAWVLHRTGRRDESRNELAAALSARGAFESQAEAEVLRRELGV